MFDDVQKLLLQLYLDNQQSENATAEFCFCLSKEYFEELFPSSPEVGKGKGSSFLDMLIIELKLLLQLPHAVKHHVYMSGPHDEQIAGSRLRS